MFNRYINQLTLKLFRKHISMEPDSFKEFYHHNNRYVYEFIGRSVKNKEDILDIMQEVFIHLWKYKDSLTKENTGSIIHKACNQKIFDFYKRSQRQPCVNLQNTEYIQDNSQSDMEDKLKKEQGIEAIEKSLEFMPALRKEIFVLNKIEGITQKQIALRMNMSKSAVENHIAKAMNFLRNLHENS